MTTKVTVDAHAGWPVEVKTINGEPGQPQTESVAVVDPNTTRDFYIHSGMQITGVRELDRPASPPAD
jgi:hypothetical protein